MTTWRGRGCRAAHSSTLRAAGVGLMAVVALAAPALAGGGTDDPRDVGTSLDLKVLTHVVDGATIVYTAETYAPFPDEAAAFKWGIDRDGDEAFDLIVFTEWRGGKLAGGVRDPSGREVAPALVSRPQPTAIRVSFPTRLLGGTAAYRYAVDAEAAGQRDLAPNSGLIQHRLGTTAPASTSDEPRSASSGAASTPTTSAAAKPVPPVPAPQAASERVPGARLPRTGAEDRTLLPWAGAALVTGGGLVALGAQRRRLRDREVTGGIR